MVSGFLGQEPASLVRPALRFCRMGPFPHVQSRHHANTFLSQIVGPDGRISGIRMFLLKPSPHLE
jgi:hypothetical protein